MYIPLVQAARNDVTGLLNLDNGLKKNVLPLLDVCSTTTKNILEFCQKWPTTSRFFVDISPIAITLSNASDADPSKHVIKKLCLDESKDGFATRLDFYLELQSEHSALIPSISWEGVKSPRRDVLRFALSLLNNFDNIAIRVCLWDKKSNHSQNLDYTQAILDVIEDQSKVWLLIDYGPLEQINSLTSSSRIADYLAIINATPLAGWSVISTSFPEQRPSRGSSGTSASIDYWAQSLLSTTHNNSIRAYGDYASSTLGSATGYIPGMAIIPFAGYLRNFEWWLTRQGRDKEYDNYINIANIIVNLPQYHGTTFCWANENYERISKIANPSLKGYGNNGTWNGYRINQHITEILHSIHHHGFPGSISTDPSEDEGEDI